MSLSMEDKGLIFGSKEVNRSNLSPNGSREKLHIHVERVGEGQGK